MTWQIVVWEILWTLFGGFAGGWIGFQVLKYLIRTTSWFG